MNATNVRHVEIFDVTDAGRLTEALRVRFAVFVEEQRVPADEEIDDHDRTDREAVHAILRDRSGVIAAGRFYRLDDRTAQIGRMAVSLSARRSGAGSLLLEALVQEARRRGYARVSLHAQDHAVGFYARYGFEAVGATMLDAGIVHQPMERTLAATAPNT